MPFINKCGGGGGGNALDAIIDGTAKEIKSNVKTIPRYALYQFESMEALELLEVSVIPQRLAQYCTALKKINMPLATTAEDYAFGHCAALTEVNIPKVETLGSAFYSCTALAKLDLPNVTTITANAFQMCAALVAVIIRTNSVCSLGSTNIFTSTPIKSGSGYIYVPSALVSSYKSDSKWSTFAAKIRAIEDYPEICG